MMIPRYMPTFSIITALYNKAPYIEETIRSVLAQTESNWEMILVDNGSTDGGDQKALDLIQGNSAFHFMRFTERQGPAAARNEGLRHAKGEWVIFLDADDLLSPDWAKRMTQEVVKASGVVASPWRVRHDASGHEGIAFPPGFPRRPELLKETSIAYCPWPPNAAVIRREHLTADFQWPEHFDRLVSEDTVFWFRILQEQPVHFVDAPLSIYRHEAEGGRDRSKSPEAWAEAVMTIHEENVKWLEERRGLIRADQWYWLYRVEESLLKTLSVEGETKQAVHLRRRRYFQEFCRRAPGLQWWNRLKYGIKSLT